MNSEAIDMEEHIGATAQGKRSGHGGVGLAKAMELLLFWIKGA